MELLVQELSFVQIINNILLQDQAHLQFVLFPQKPLIIISFLMSLLQAAVEAVVMVLEVAVQAAIENIKAQRIVIQLRL